MHTDYVIALVAVCTAYCALQNVVFTLHYIYRSAGLFQGQEDGYVCYKCFGRLEVQYREDPFQINSSIRDKRKPMSRNRHKSTRQVVQAFISALNTSQYGRVFRLLIDLCPSSQKAFDSIVSRQVRRQINALLRRKDFVFPVFNGSKSVESFSWESMVGTLSRELPTLYAAVTASMPADDKQPTYVFILYICICMCMCMCMYVCMYVCINW